MKKIINGKKYDTDTAKMLAEYDNDLPTTDFRHYKEQLYVKKTGEYFLYGEGGGLSSYAESCCGDGWSSGENIIPYTENDAKKWAEKKLSADEYEAIFGEVEE